MAPPSWVEVIYVIPLYEVSRGLNQGCGSRDLVLVSRPIKTIFEVLFLVLVSTLLVLVLVLVSEGGLEQDLKLCVC